MPDLVRVLMVEDVADDAALIERELRRAGITGAARRVDSERAYREALQTFAPDIILTDHSLPTFGAADAHDVANNHLEARAPPGVHANANEVVLDDADPGARLDVLRRRFFVEAA